MRQEEAPARAALSGDIGLSGERLTRDEAFDLVRRSIQSLTTGEDDAVRAADVRGRARNLLGRDSESLSERNFARILRDAHDANVVDLRRRGDDFEVARAAEAESVADQLAKAAAAHPAAATVPSAAPVRRGMGPRGGGRGRPSSPGMLPPELLSIGVVDTGAPMAPEPEPAPELVAVTELVEPSTSAEPIEEETSAPAKASKPRRPRASAKKAARPGRAAAAPPPEEEEPRSKPRRSRARKPAGQGSQG
jgi:hypothetical protein